MPEWLTTDGSLVGSLASPVDSLTSEAILTIAKFSGEWDYTQGCAHCFYPKDSVAYPWPTHGPYNEPPVDTAHSPNRRGDCTDYVQFAARHVLGTTFTRWKIATTMFHRFSANGWTDSLTKYGYVEVDSGHVRRGDVVVRLKAQSKDSSGHAGLFAGWGARNDGIIQGHPIGWANNGSPASWKRDHRESVTGRTDFVRGGADSVLKFFRQLHN